MRVLDIKVHCLKFTVKVIIFNRLIDQWSGIRLDPWCEFPWEKMEGERLDSIVRHKIDARWNSVHKRQCKTQSVVCQKGGCLSLPCAGAFLSYQRVSISTLVLLRERRSKSKLGLLTLPLEAWEMSSDHTVKPGPIPWHKQSEYVCI